MVDEWVVEISRWQFAASALYHFLFVPLTLGLSLLLALMETLYVTRGRQLYRDMARFWGKVLLINFSIGVITGLTLEFQFASSWGHFSQFASGVFGMPMVLENLLSFFLQAAAIGLMLFGWERLAPRQHLAVTWLVVFCTHLSAFWMMANNSLMQWPQGLQVDPLTLQAQSHSLARLLFNQHSVAAFVHTSAAAYLIAAACVCGASGWYLLGRRYVEFARETFRIAALFGLIATLAVLLLGNAYSYYSGDLQPAKRVAIEGGRATAVKQFEKQALERVQSGVQAVIAMQQLRQNPQDAEARKQFLAHRADLGYGLLVKRLAPQADVRLASPDELTAAAKAALPDVLAVHWSFLLMVLLGAVLLIYFLIAAVRGRGDDLPGRRSLLHLSLWMIPVPFAAAEAGWVVNEMGRQPWVVHDLLPTWMAVSARSVTFLTVSMGGLAFLHMVLVVLELYLLMRTVQNGPDLQWQLPGGEVVASSPESGAGLA